MTDIYSKKRRSEIMSRIRSSGTAPEQRLYAMLRSVLGHRWRIDSNVQNLPGRPDFLIPSLNLIVFADGCFYHSCPVHGHIPKTNSRYWSPKLRLNYLRDAANRRRLRRLGYSVWRFWEHDLAGRSIDKAYGRLEALLIKQLRHRTRQLVTREWRRHI